MLKTSVSQVQAETVKTEQRSRKAESQKNDDWGSTQLVKHESGGKTEANG